MVLFSSRRVEGGELVVVDGSLEDYHPAQSRTDPGTWRGEGVCDRSDESAGEDRIRYAGTRGLRSGVAEGGLEALFMCEATRSNSR